MTGPGITIGRVHLRLFLEPRDLWVGIYVRRPWWEGGRFTHQLFICPLPTLVLAISWVGPVAA